MGFSEALKRNAKRAAHFQCCICRAVNVEIHHIVPQEEGGTDDKTNAAPLCPSCHEIYGANRTKRKFIREARDLWYEICEKRFAGDGSLVKDVRIGIKSLPSKGDLNKLRRDVLRIVSSTKDGAGLLHGQVILGRPASGVRAEHVVRVLSIEDLMAMLYTHKSRRPRQQVRVLLLEGWFTEPDALREFRKFKRLFGENTAELVAARLLDDRKVPHGLGLTMKELKKCTGAFVVDIVLMMLCHRKRIQAGIDADGDLTFMPPSKFLSRTKERRKTKS